MANLALKNQWIPKKKHPSLSFVSSLVFLCIGGFMTYHVTGNIDGKWYNSSLGREYSSTCLKV